MASITTWTRLEPRSRGDDLTPSLEARVHDPAWLLGRQWQVGEFVGDDAGTPVHVSITAEAQPIVAARAGNREIAVDPDEPIDSVAGAEPAGVATFAERAEAGAELLDRLADAGCSPQAIAALIGSRLMPADWTAASAEGTALLTLVAGRLPDGEANLPVMQAIATAGVVPVALGLTGTDATAALDGVRGWLDWRRSLLHTAPAATWIDDQLEHRFALAATPAAGAAYALSARSWDGDRLDWDDVDIDRTVAPPVRPASAPAQRPLAGVDPATSSITAEGLPAPLGYPGMPASRWWQFEDARVNFAEIAAAPEDLARMLVVEFATVFSNDWYLWPLDLPIGAVHRITNFKVVNTFGDVEVIRAAGVSAAGSTTPDWQLFRPTERRTGGTVGTFDGLVVLPTLASPIQGEVFEEVRFMRDEIANLAWAIESTVRGDDGLPFDRHGAAAREGEFPPERTETHADDTALLRYRFETDVPVYWFPLAPDAAGAPTFHRLVVRRVDEAGNVRSMPPLGDVLAPAGFWLWQEEVPREGARVLRRWCMARGGDGRVRVWRSRRAEVGFGEGSSGLRYDDAVPVPEETP